MLRLRSVCLACGFVCGSVAALPAQTDPDTVRATQLREVVIPGKPPKPLLGAQRQRPDGHEELPHGYRLALRICNPYQRSVRIRHLQYYVLKHGRPDAPVRLSLHHAAPGDSLPGAAWYTSPTLYAASHGWVTYEPADTLLLPPDGGWMVLTKVYGGAHYVWTRRDREGEWHLYGAVTGLTREFPDARPVVTRTDAAHWWIEPYPDTPRHGGNLVPMLRLLVAPGHPYGPPPPGAASTGQ